MATVELLKKIISNGLRDAERIMHEARQLARHAYKAHPIYRELWGDE
jgi:hypothetical protein